MARSPAKRIVGALLFVIAAIVTVGLLFIRRWDARAARAESGEVFFVPEDVRRPQPAPTTSFEAVPDVVVYDLAKVPLASRAWAGAEKDGTQHPYYFPASVAAGVYVNDYLDLGRGRTLKLRTLMAGPDGPYADTSQPRSRSRAPAPAATGNAAKSLLASAAG